MATTTLDRYRHIATLGSGGMATVFLAEDTVLGREVALKQIKTGGDERSLSRLRREALIGASVSHPNLVSIYDVVTLEDGDQVIVMEYVPGETLRDALFRETRLTPVNALRMLEGVSAGLDAIHREGIVHRDVKPANILLGGGDTVKLADLGVASIPDRTRITTDGALVGTFSYMAPEQLSGTAVTKATDVYALSAVAFEALCGRKAHPESNPVALAHAVATQPAPDLRDVWPGAPAAAAEVLIRGMSKDPADRPRSASELTGRLRAALDPYTTAPQAPVSAPAARRPPAAPVAAAVSDPPEPAPPAPAPDHAVPAAASAAGAAAAAAEGVRAEDAQAAPARSEPEPPATVAPIRPRPAKAAASGDAAAGRRGDPGAGRKAGLIAGALIPLIALAVVLPILLTSGGKSRAGASTAAHHGAPATTAAHHKSSSGGAATSTSQGAATTPSSNSGAAAGSAAGGAAAAGSATGGSATAGSPTSAVETFYGYAASHRYSDAWALADPTFRSQLGGYSAFSAQQSGDRRITFNSASVTNQTPTTATVSIQTTSVRNSGTQQCSGTVDLARASSSAGWLLHLIHINCQ